MRKRKSTNNDKHFQKKQSRLVYVSSHLPNMLAHHANMTGMSRCICDFWTRDALYTQDSKSGM